MRARLCWIGWFGLLAAGCSSGAPAPDSLDGSAGADSSGRTGASAGRTSAGQGGTSEGQGGVGASGGSSPTDVSCAAAPATCLACCQDASPSGAALYNQVADACACQGPCEADCAADCAAMQLESTSCGSCLGSALSGGSCSLAACQADASCGAFLGCIGGCPSEFAPGGSSGGGQGGATTGTGGQGGATPSGGTTQAGAGGAATNTGQGGSMTTAGQGGTAPAAGQAGTGGTGPVSEYSCSSDAGDPYAAARQDCVKTINMYRATLGLTPYKRWCGEDMCIDAQPKADAAANTAHSAFGTCNEFAQNECPDWPGPPDSSIDMCLAQMWAEGPGTDFETHGHYINMSSTMYSEVECGFYVLADGSYWGVQDFQ